MTKNSTGGACVVKAGGVVFWYAELRTVHHVGMLLGAIALAAAVIPAVRAARVDPMLAMRAE